MAKFTTQEFNSLARHANGDIIDLQMNQIRMTAKQRETVSEDDFTRLDENDEEMRHMMADLASEFG